MAEAGVEVIDDDVRLAVLFGADGKLAGRVNLEEFGDLVSENHQLDSSVANCGRVAEELPISHICSLFGV